MAKFLSVVLVVLELYHPCDFKSLDSTALNNAGYYLNALDNSLQGVQGSNRQDLCCSKLRLGSSTAVSVLRLRGSGRPSASIVGKARAQDIKLRKIKKAQKAKTRYKAGTVGFLPFIGPHLYALGGRSTHFELRCDFDDRTWRSRPLRFSVARPSLKSHLHTRSNILCLARHAASCIAMTSERGRGHSYRRRPKRRVPAPTPTRPREECRCRAPPSRLCGPSPRTHAPASVATESAPRRRRGVAAAPRRRASSRSPRNQRRWQTDTFASLSSNKGLA